MAEEFRMSSSEFISPRKRSRISDLVVRLFKGNVVLRCRPTVILTCGMTEITERRSVRPNFEMSRSSMKIFPLGSTNRSKQTKMDDLPTPVRPTIPTCTILKIVRNQIASYSVENDEFALSVRRYLYSYLSYLTCYVS